MTPAPQNVQNQTNLGKKLKLPTSFYEQKTESVAKRLLGKKLVRIYKGERISGLITETEAYLGATDPACHTFGHRKTPRVQSMYLSGGHAYVYQIYGMHFCFNVVTRTPQHPEAVLIRALEPLEGLDWMKKFRVESNVRNLTTGPAKLCEALQINKAQDGECLTDDELFIEDAKPVASKDIVAKPRIGVAYAKEAAQWPLRFYIRENVFISKK